MLHGGIVAKRRSVDLRRDPGHYTSRMNRHTLLRSSAAALLAVSAVASTADAGDGRPAVGEVYPEVRLPTIDGERTVSLHGLRGKKVLLIEFASW